MATTARPEHADSHLSSTVSTSGTPSRSGLGTLGAGRTRSRATTLEVAYNPRSNSLDVIRLILATTVAVAHASAIASGWQPSIGGTDVSAFAVDGFFVLSGFLITSSFLRLSPGRYVWHRFLRIMPAFWLCLALTAFVVAPLIALLEGRPALSVFAGAEPAWRYVTDNALLYMNSFGVAGLPSGTAQPGVVNGALWTLFYEAVCYGLVLVLGVAGALTRRTWMTHLVVAVSGLMLTLPLLGIDVRGELFWRFFFVFTLGALAYVHRDRIPITRGLTIGAAALTLASALLLTDYRPLGGLAFAYLCLVAVVATPRLRRRLPTDLSYGMYVYHWPIQVLLVLAGVSALPAPIYVTVSVLCAGVAAYASWHLVEKRALAMKNAFKRP
ncbi:MAG: acyltransferase [Dermatophilus congolensis]|nr:acyltransferase [Dermatophilus congolensis]